MDVPVIRISTGRHHQPNSLMIEGREPLHVDEVGVGVGWGVLGLIIIRNGYSAVFTPGAGMVCLVYSEASQLLRVQWHLFTTSSAAIVIPLISLKLILYSPGHAPQHTLCRLDIM